MASVPATRGNPYATTSTSAALFHGALFDALTVIDTNGAVQPALALSWRAESETRWLFSLRPNVRFSNGEPFDAAAVKAVFDFFASPAASAQSVPREVDFVTAVDVVDPLTVALTTASPQILLPRYMAAVPIVAPNAFQKLGLDGFAAAPVGTGPFKLEHWGPERVRFVAVPDSWRPPRVDALDVRVIPEPGARVDALETGAVDIAITVNPEHLARLKAANLRAVQRNPTRVQVIGLNSVVPGSPFKDVRVRQAMNYAVNRDLITRELLAGLVGPASQPATAVALGFDPDLAPYPYDPDKARDLLRAAGYPKGFRFVAELPTGYGANDMAINQQIAADLARVEVRMDIRTILLPQVIQNMNQGGWKGTAFQVDFATAPSLDALRPIRLHSCGWVAPWYCDPAIEPVIAAAGRSFDLERRAALTRQVMRHYRDQAQSLFMFPVLSLDGLGPRVSAWEPWNDNLRLDAAALAP
jgi:peptide/nickel transport system substrate-binding protein